MNKKNLIFLQLNEINFNLVKLYLDEIKLDAFQEITKTYTETTSEDKYELLEPWIQWTSINTGLSANEHNIFRLSDIQKFKKDQIYEKIESLGYSVGAVSPMNTLNNLAKPAFFIPDPWTQTKNDDSFWSKLISKVLSKEVNSNANKNVDINSLITLAIIVIRFARPKNYLKYISLFLKSIKKKWFRAIFLDLLLSDIFLSLLQNKQPNFASLFLNGGAHIQHHYLANSKYSKKTIKNNPSWLISQNDDPFRDMIKVYDQIISDVMDHDKYDLLIATGLTQVPNERNEFYYRLKDHDKFLKLIGIKYLNIVPLMSRDFIVNFLNENEANEAFNILKSLEVDKEKLLFDQIDNRGKSLFITLTFPDEINNATILKTKDKEIRLKEHVSFVAIKNGKHSGTGFLYSKNNKHFLKNNNNITNIYAGILNYFK
tara:strand:- start:8103 stop:9389 length:1287 start_codon:yes stop_codon:yes gene_type:complete